MRLFGATLAPSGGRHTSRGPLARASSPRNGHVLHESEDDSREACAAPDAAVDAHAARRADALTLLAETFLAQGAAPLAAAERYQVILHVAESVLREPSDDADGSREQVVDAHAQRERVGGGRGSREQVGDERAPQGLAAEELCEAHRRDEGVIGFAAEVTDFALMRQQSLLARCSPVF
jgi:hypothetical protein